MALKVTYQDRAEYGGFIANYKPDTPNCEPYYELKMGADLTVFIEPDRLQELEDVLKVARCERETAEALASMEATA